VDDPCHLIAAVGEIPLDRVENHRPDHVADVTFLIDRRSAQIDADLAGRDRLKWLFLLRQRVINSYWHWSLLLGHWSFASSSSATHCALISSSRPIAPPPSPFFAF